MSIRIGSAGPSTNGETLLGVPLAMLCAYGLYRFVERPCLPARPSTSSARERTPTTLVGVR
jgi:peptidoglycan/LPS O-acetylase OafA/YrhL